MNKARRLKLLRLRARADRFEIEAIEASSRAGQLRAEAGKAIDDADARARAAEAKVAAEIAKVAAGSTEVRQKIARLETFLARAVEALEYLDPRAPIEGLSSVASATVTNLRGSPAPWKLIIEREDLWYAERGRMIRGELKAIGLKRPEPGVPGFVTADDGQSVSFLPAGHAALLPDEQ